MSAASQVHDATSHLPPSMFGTKQKVIAGIVVPALVGGIAYGVHRAKERSDGKEKTASAPIEPLSEEQIRQTFAEKGASFKERFADFLDNDPNNHKVKALMYGIGGVTGAGLGALGGVADNAANPSRDEEERRKMLILNTVMGGAGGLMGSHLALTGAGL